MSPIFDTVTGVSIEVFYADNSLISFGKCGAGWFWWPRRRGFAPDGPAKRPFGTSYSAYRHALQHGAENVSNKGHEGDRKVGACFPPASPREG
jgi:hypothetical protein